MVCVCVCAFFFPVCEGEQEATVACEGEQEATVAKGGEEVQKAPKSKKKERFSGKIQREPKI